MGGKGGKGKANEGRRGNGTGNVPWPEKTKKSHKRNCSHEDQCVAESNGIGKVSCNKCGKQLLRMTMDVVGCDSLRIISMKDSKFRPCPRN